MSQHSRLTVATLTATAMVELRRHSSLSSDASRRLPSLTVLARPKRHSRASSHVYAYAAYPPDQHHPTALGIDGAAYDASSNAGCAPRRQWRVSRASRCRSFSSSVEVSSHHFPL